jgi:hypothetical protein
VLSRGLALAAHVVEQAVAQLPEELDDRHARLARRPASRASALRGVVPVISQQTSAS